MHGVTRHFKSKKFKKNSETHETLLDVILCHQDDVVKKIGMFDESFDTHHHKPKKLTRRLVVPRGNNACLMTNGR